MTKGRKKIDDNLKMISFKVSENALKSLKKLAHKNEITLSEFLRGEIYSKVLNSSFEKKEEKPISDFSTSEPMFDFSSGPNIEFEKQ